MDKKQPQHAPAVDDLQTAFKKLRVNFNSEGRRVASGLQKHHHHHHHHHHQQQQQHHHQQPPQTHQGSNSRATPDLVGVNARLRNQGPSPSSALQGSLSSGTALRAGSNSVGSLGQLQQNVLRLPANAASAAGINNMAGSLSRTLPHGSQHFSGNHAAPGAHQVGSTANQPPQPQGTPPGLSAADNQSPAQRQAAAKLALRKQLEKTLLQIPPPKPPPPEMHFVPNASSPEFVYLLGLETVVSFLTDGEASSRAAPPEPFACSQCGLDFTPVWKWQDTRRAGRPSVICEACVTSNLKKALKAEHTHRLKTAFVKALQQEQEIEQRLASGAAPSPPPSSTPPPAAHSPRLGTAAGSGGFLPKLSAQQLLQAQQLQQLASLPGASQHQGTSGTPQPAHVLPFGPLLAAYSYQMLSAAGAAGAAGKLPPAADLHRQYLLDMIPPRSMAQGSLNWKT
uniref:Transcriptional repressor p66 alpha like isoform 3 n=1 Tax=Rhipicephalus appendiculatus TaxID=34631 RepID=A0A131Y9F2_RHIAP